MPHKRHNAPGTPYEKQQLAIAMEIIRRELRRERVGIVIGRDANAQFRWKSRGLSLKQRDRAVEELVNIGEAMLEVRDSTILLRLVQHSSETSDDKK